MSKIDPTALEKALKDLKKGQSDIANAKTRQATLTKEVEQIRESSDPDDEQSIRNMTSFKTQLEMYPGHIERLEKGLRQLLSELDKASKHFANDLAGHRSEENAALNKERELVLRPFHPKGGSQRAAVPPGAVVVVINERDGNTIGKRKAGIAGLHGAHHYAASILRAEELLQIHAELKANGYRWQPEIWKALGK